MGTRLQSRPSIVQCACAHRHLVTRRQSNVCASTMHSHSPTLPPRKRLTAAPSLSCARTRARSHQHSDQCATRTSPLEGQARPINVFSASQYLSSARPRRIRAFTCSQADTSAINKHSHELQRDALADITNAPRLIPRPSRAPLACLTRTAHTDTSTINRRAHAI